MSEDEQFVVKKKRGRGNIMLSKEKVFDHAHDEDDIVSVAPTHGPASKKEKVIISGDLAEELVAIHDHKPLDDTLEKVGKATDNAQPVTSKKTYALQKQSSAVAGRSEKYQFSPDNAKPTCRFDYAKDLCKDYNESGYCVFGDTCIFLHDRGDYKSGWELELDWNNQMKASSEAALAKEEPSDNEMDSTCKICQKELQAPVSAECGHIFCETCALSEMNTSKKCPLCKKTWKGSFKVIK